MPCASPHGFGKAIILSLGISRQFHDIVFTGKRSFYYRTLNLSQDPSCEQEDSGGTCLKGQLRNQCTSCKRAGCLERPQERRGGNQVWGKEGHGMARHGTLRWEHKRRQLPSPLEAHRLGRGWTWERILWYCVRARKGRAHWCLFKPSDSMSLTAPQGSDGKKKFMVP